MPPRCIYGTCRAVNLCKFDHCVGEELDKAGLEIRDGVTVAKRPSPHTKEKQDAE